MSNVRFEQVAVSVGERSGCTVAVAIHSTRLGPALGGARMWHYPDADAVVADAKRLAAAMTLKAAAAGLELGGGKGVIAAPWPRSPTGELRRALLLDFADLVDSLGGRYVTAEDVGTGAADMAVIAERTEHVVGLDTDRGGSGDPSPITALGVLAAIRACASHRLGTRELEGMRACVVGFGHAGGRLAELLAANGVELLISDIDPARRAPAERLGARWIEPDEAMEVDCDVLAPCALGGAITPGNVDALRASIVCGAANNVLSSGSLADHLAGRGVLVAPDFIANAGGLISVYGELHGIPHELAIELAAGIEGTLGRILADADARSITPLEAARELAARRLERGSPVLSPSLG